MRKPCMVCGREIDKSESVAVTLFLCSEECKQTRKASMPKRKTKVTVEYWQDRGFSEQEAQAKVSEIQKSRSPRCAEYWIRRGMTPQQARDKVSEHQKKIAAKRMEKTTHQQRQANSPFSAVYWIARGFSPVEAKDILSERSNTVSLEAFVARLGPEEGQKQYDELCRHRRESYNLAGYIQRHGEDRGRELWTKKYKQRYDSLKARQFIDRLLMAIPEEMEVYWAGNDRGEYGVNNGTEYYFYDLVIPDAGLAVEYHGDYWHCHPDKYPEDYVHPHIGLTALQIQEKDHRKIEALKEQRGFDVVVVWESDNVEESITKIKEKINELYQSQNQEQA